MPDLGHVSHPSTSNHLSAVRSAVPSRAFPEKLPCPRRRSCLGKDPSRLRDRYVPQRSYSGNTTSKFHIRKLPTELAAHEKLLRQRERGENPFGRRRRTGVPEVHLDIDDVFQPPHMSPHLLDSELNPRQFSTSGQRVTPRQVSVGAVWNVGGASIATRGLWLGIVEGRKMYFKRNVTAPLYIARYWTNRNISSSEQREINRSRLAAAFDMDLAHRQLLISKPAMSAETCLCASSPHFEKALPLAWRDCTWKRADIEVDTRGGPIKKRSSVSGVPFRTLVTKPPIIDDFYHSVLAYCHSSGLLAYAVLDTIVLWSTRTCKKVKKFRPGYPQDCVTALAFSSSSGGKSMLAVATCSGHLHLWETVELRRRFSWRFHEKLTCVTFRPTTTWCQSAVIPGAEIPVEQMAVGDERGTIWYYSIELSPFESLSRVTLLAIVDAHLARICSITWSPDKRFLATSGDDNLCLLFEIRHILQNQQSLNTAMRAYPETGILPRLRLSQGRLSAIVSQVARMLRISSRVVPLYSLSRSQPLEDPVSRTSSTSGHVRSVSMEGDDAQANITHRRVRGGALDTTSQPRPRGISRFQPYRRVASAYYPPSLESYGQTALHFLHGNHVHHFKHNSAVKAVAFAPWQPTLLATGGGMSDRTVHFYHAPTGSCLAKIYMWSQVTGLIWSKTRREIAVVLGFSDYENEHQYRVVVFAWPSCQQVTAIPWNSLVGEDSREYVNMTDRALSVISIPHFIDPIHKIPGDVDANPEDECVAIASPRYIRFYRIWATPHKVFTGTAGIMQSRILEALDGIEDPRDEVIR